MKFKSLLFIVTSILLITSCTQKEDITLPVVTDEMSVESIDVSALNTEATRYFNNMATFVQLTTGEMDNQTAIGLKSVNVTDEDSVANPILDAFVNLDIEDEYGNPISYFDLSEEERVQFLETWSIGNAYDMTPKLNDTIMGEDLEEYVQIQNDAFDEVMAQYEQNSVGLKSANVLLNSNDLYNQISQRVQERIEEKSTTYSETYLANNPEISVKLKSATSHSDYVNPDEVLKQLRQHANRGDVLINLPGSVWLSAYLFYYNPLAITKYVGIGKYPPGHVSIVTKSKTAISSKYTDVSISSQNYSNNNGVQYEQISGEWDCKAHLCYVKKRKWVWRGFRSGFKTVYPNHDKVISYAESQIGKPYCSGWDFITAKGRTSCFICTTITWRSFDREGFNIHRVWARWMPTIAPADVYLSSHVKRKHRIK